MVSYEKQLTFVQSFGLNDNSEELSFISLVQRKGLLSDLCQAAAPKLLFWLLLTAPKGREKSTGRW